jgi:hypothetical protein
MKRGYTLSEADAVLRRRRQVGRALGLDEPDLLTLGDSERRARRSRLLDEEAARTAREPLLHS